MTDHQHAPETAADTDGDLPEPYLTELAPGVHAFIQRTAAGV